MPIYNYTSMEIVYEYMILYENLVCVYISLCKECNCVIIRYVYILQYVLSTCIQMTFILYVGILLLVL